MVIASPLWEEAGVEAMVTSSFTSLRRGATPASAFLSCGGGYDIAMTPTPPSRKAREDGCGDQSSFTRKKEKVAMASSSSPLDTRESEGMDTSKYTSLRRGPLFCY